MARPSPASTVPIGERCRSASLLLAGNGRASVRLIHGSETVAADDQQQLRTGRWMRAPLPVRTRGASLRLEILIARGAMADRPAAVTKRAVWPQRAARRQQRFRTHAATHLAAVRTRGATIAGLDRGGSPVSQIATSRAPRLRRAPRRSGTLRWPGSKRVQQARRRRQASGGRRPPRPGPGTSNPAPGVQLCFKWESSLSGNRAERAQGGGNAPANPS
jgi:hypothetical protein